jgi:hypothetical protein
VLRRVLAAVCVLGSLGAGSSDPVSDPLACPGRCERPIGYTLDAHFSPQERLLAEQAMQVWEGGTNGRVCFVPGGRDLVIERLDRPQELEPFDGEWQRHVALTKGDHIWIVASRVDEPGEFRALVVHELGHRLGIGHIDDTQQTYMHTTINDTPPDLWKHARLPDRDARAYCAVNACTCSF